MRYRITRRRYVVGSLLWIVPGYILVTFAGGTGRTDGLWWIVLLFFSPVWVWLGIGRLHDIGWNGWWILLQLIPTANVVVGLILLLAGRRLARTSTARILEIEQHVQSQADDVVHWLEQSGLVRPVPNPRLRGQGVG